MSTFSHAFITGASSGVGRALARDLANKGTHVTATARRAPELRSLVDEIASSGGKADLCVIDVTDPDRIQACIRQWGQATGGLDLVIVNAGVVWPFIEPPNLCTKETAAVSARPSPSCRPRSRYQPSTTRIAIRITELST